PLEYSLEGWAFVKFRPKLTILDVEIDGQGAPFHTKKKSGLLRIYIGSSNKFLPPGLHTFLLTYQVERIIRYFKDFDELYWNVTGSGWAFPILKAEATVSLPEPAGFVRYATYTGRPGSSHTTARVVDVTGRQIKFETTSPLYPGEDFTIAVAWPKGVVAEPSTLAKIGYFIRDNFWQFGAILLLFVVTAYYIYTWKQVGKDPDLGPIVPRFNPPKNIGPSAARFIRKMGFDNKTFAVCLVNLAVKGAVRIKKTNGDYQLEKTDLAPKEKLTEGEDKVLKVLFGTSPVVTLSQAYRSKINSAMQILKESLRRRYEMVYFLTNRRYLVPGLVMSGLALLMLAAGAREFVPAIFITAWLTGWAGFSLILIGNALMGLRGLGSMPWRQRIATFRDVVFSLMFLLGIAVGGSFYYMLLGATSLVIYVLLALVNFTFYHLMKAPTMKGAKILAELEGFRMFLKTAEAPRLEALTPPDKAPELFEKYLPWAMALDVENQWAQRFQEYLEAAGLPPVQPAWFYGPHFYDMSSVSSSLGEGLNSAISTATISRTSASGGGGFSGGGGGGGGGGGW
ncbi:MAG: DUF2207 domain-containing protein, partial [Thermodesulfobacteria bacterium]|nr:DUF2207 domain-containing protein [Thermodesulfobacteriota bacterium]